MKGLVLAGGYGTRLRPLTHTGPKQLIPIANKPNILYCIEDLRDAGITEIGIILGNVMPEKVQEFLGDGSEFGVKFTYIVQGEPKGIAHAINCSKNFMGGDSFIVYLGDNLLKNGISAIPALMETESADCVISLMPVKEPQQTLLLSQPKVLFLDSKLNFHHQKRWNLWEIAVMFQTFSE